LSIQVNEYETAFFGGSVYDTGIITYDWRYNNYTKHSIDLNMARVGSACTLYKDPNGTVKVKKFNNLRRHSGFSEIS
jgi:hypothetical protein